MYVHIHACTGLTSIIQHTLYTNIADLSVDWINGKLYWVDRELCEIGEYDLVSNTRRYVMSTGTAETSNPLGIVVYPYPDYGYEMML